MNHHKVIFLVLLFSVNAILCFSQAVRDYRQEAQLLKRSIEANHVQAKLLNDEFSESVFTNFINTLDPEQLYFTASEIKSLEKYATKIDDELKQNGWTFFTAVSAIYKAALIRSQAISVELLSKPFEFSTNEIYKLDTVWCATEADQRNRWRLYLKYRILSDLGGSLQASDTKETVAQKEPAARRRTQARITRSFNKVLNATEGYNNYLGRIYLESIASTYDPHTAYLSPSMMENFMSSLSNQGYYFGFRLDETEHGDVTIEDLTPGGPAWKSGVLKSGDVVEQVNWTGSKPVEASIAGLEEVSELLSETNHSTLEISVRRPSGEKEKIVLRKELIQSEDNIVKSAILQAEHKFGFISLPGFYTDWGDVTGSQCAADVAKEIIKLKKSGIEGLILDLRFNGGGSMSEAVAMAGIFLDAGPVGVIVNKSGEMTTMKDMNRGTVYDGPLIIMVNSLSASASEFFAAALQDHHRAIIIGSQTFGKATAQGLFPMDGRNVTAGMTGSAKPGAAYVKVTTEKIYRITGKTAQTIGVIPDIILPDLYEEMGFQERFMDGAFPGDSINKKMYYQPLAALPLGQLAEQSARRINANVAFDQISKMANLIGEQELGVDSISLEWSQFKEEQLKLKQLYAATQTESVSAQSAFSVVLNDVETQRMKLDDYILNINTVWVKKLERDILLAEVFHILCDYIKVVQK
jgi:carboxyl-terminal processing protease